MKIVGEGDFIATLLDRIDLPPGLELTDLDSLARFELLLVMEHEFDVEMDDEVMASCHSWSALHQSYIAARVDADMAP